ncbi:MAG: rhamnulokinase [Oligoflexia bacterium]|nr:rhamnulokinase [Oligoflexia bacterium]
MKDKISKFLAFDFGAESARATVGIIDSDNIKKKKLSLIEIYRFPNKQITIDGHIHWDIKYLFEELKKALALTVQKGHGDIKSIAVDTWGVDFALINSANGELLFNTPFCYRDSRTNGVMEEVFNHCMSKEEIYNRTGIGLMQINSIYQLYATNTNKKSLIKKDATGTQETKLLFMPDLFNYLLTGKIFSEYTIASTSQLLNAHTKKWDEEIFKRLNLPIEIMPEIIEPKTKIGKLRLEIATEVGLANKNVEVVAVASHDTASAVAAASGRTTSGRAYISSGTWSLLGIESCVPIINPDSLKNDFTNEGGIDGKIRFLKNMMGMWPLQRCKKEWQERFNYDESYEKMMELATSDVRANFKCIIDFDNQLFLNPPSMIDTIINFCKTNHQNHQNQMIPERKGEFVKCIIESLAYKYSEVIEKINSLTYENPKIQFINIVGGGSQNEMLNQLTASAAKIPVLAGPVEATTIGNIITQAMAFADIDNLNEGRLIIANSFTIKTYNP